MPSVIAAPVAVPAMPAGAALAPGVALARTQRAYAEAKEHCWQLRDEGAPKPQRRAARQAREVAQAAFAAASMAYWASPEGQRRTRILEAAYRRYHLI